MLTFAALALQNGVDVKTASSMLGHYDAGFTLRTYTHATRPDAAKGCGNDWQLHSADHVNEKQEKARGRKKNFLPRAF